MKLFIYGTLKQEQKNPGIQVQTEMGIVGLNPTVLNWDIATKPNYRLFGYTPSGGYGDLRFPCLVEGDKANRYQVHGQLIEIPDHQIKTYDAIEGFIPGDEKKSLYVRKPVELDDGQEAVAYFYNDEVKGLPELTNGRW